MPKSDDQRESQRAHDVRRAANKPWRVWYSSAIWRSLRAAQLQREPLCARCLAHNRLTPANTVHHRIRHEGNAGLFYDAKNLASSCRECHDSIEQRLEKSGRLTQEIGPDGWPIG